MDLKTNRQTKKKSHSKNKTIPLNWLSDIPLSIILKFKIDYVPECPMCIKLFANRYKVAI